MQNFQISFLPWNHGHYLPKESELWLKFLSRTLFHLSKLKNFWGKIHQNAVDLSFSNFSLNNPPIFIIYQNKLILLTCIKPCLKWICALGSHIGVKMTIFGITPKVKPGQNISWECSIPLKPISLFLWVNKEGLCHGTRVWVHLIWVYLFFYVFWNGWKRETNIINLLCT